MPLPEGRIPLRDMLSVEVQDPVNGAKGEIWPVFAGKTFVKYGISEKDADKIAEEYAEKKAEERKNARGTRLINLV